MDEIREAKDFAKEFLSKNPQLKEEVIDLLQLMIMEIEDDESPCMELDRFISGCEELLLD